MDLINYRLCTHIINRECRRLPWGFPGQPAPVPATCVHRCGFHGYGWWVCLPGPMDGAVAPHKVGQRGLLTWHCPGRGVEVGASRLVDRGRGHEVGRWGLSRWGHQHGIVGVGVSRWGHRDWSMGNEVGGVNVVLSVEVGASTIVFLPHKVQLDSSGLWWTLPDRA